MHLRLQPEAATRGCNPRLQPHAPEAAAARAAGVPRCSSPASPWRARSATPSPCCCSAAGAPASRMARSQRPSSSSSPEPPAHSRRRRGRMGPPPSTCGRGSCSSCYRAFASGSKRAPRAPAAACPPLALWGGRLRSGHPQSLGSQLDLPRTRSCCATGWRASSLEVASSVCHSLEAPRSSDGSALGPGCSVLSRVEPEAHGSRRGAMAVVPPPSTSHSSRRSRVPHPRRTCSSSRAGWLGHSRRTPSL